MAGYIQIVCTAQLQNNPGESKNAPHYYCLSPFRLFHGFGASRTDALATMTVYGDTGDDKLRFGFRMCDERAEVYCNDSGIVVDVVTVPLVAVTATL